MKEKKNYLILLLLVLSLCAGMAIAFSINDSEAVAKSEKLTYDSRIKDATANETKEKCCIRHSETNEIPETKPKETGCVFKTVFGEESSDSNFIYKTPRKVRTSIDEALDWMMEAQLNNGGWGAGTHARQDVTDPHSVQADPATTAMVAMAILRCDNKIINGTHSDRLNKALQYLLKQVENSDENDLNITDLKGTQPQVKLGQNIDVVLASQFLTNISDYINDPQLKQRISSCNQKCIAKIQRGQNANGSLKGAGWAGVLQSSFATNALETAKEKGLKVDEKKLDQSRAYQKNNYDVKNKSVATEEAAGVMLYSLSSTSRASAKEARVARERIDQAKKEGKIQKDAEVTADNLVKSGMGEAEAMRYESAYEVNQASKIQAQQDDVMNGFGSNGGEEFLSYLQTGEGMIRGKDVDWKKWYDNITGRLVRIQNEDGSWNGHHCITSPVFCTATSLLILSVNNDVDKLLALGGK